MAVVGKMHDRCGKEKKAEQRERKGDSKEMIQC
jgi:hypothetical protein